MYIVCSDLEGVFIPEIWISVSKHTGIDELKVTTRDINDYNALMNHRLEILRRYNLTIHDIRHVISYIKPLPGALEFIFWLKKHTQLIVVSDTFTEFADPILEKLGQPIMFCNYLTIDHLGRIADYHLRQQDGKRKVVESMQNLNLKVIAVGDSYNDINMLKQADCGILFKPPQNVVDDHGDIPVVNSFEELKDMISVQLGEVDIKLT
jgi:phosphoserine/homoserine phosphotransferase